MIIPAGYAQVSMDFVTDPVGATASVVFGVANDSVDPPADVAAAVFAASDAWVDNCVSVHAACVLIRVKNGPTATGASYEMPVSMDGDVGGDMMTPQVTLLHKKVTALGGRRHRGRMFTPFTSESVVNSLGVVDPLHQAAVNGANDDFLAGLLAAGYPMVLLHAHGSTAPDLVTSLDCQTRVATQRRRLRR